MHICRLSFLAVAVLVAGCGVQDSDPPVGKAVARRSVRQSRSKLSTITLARNISLPAGTARVKRIALSSDGALVAGIINDNIRDRLRIWRSTDGKSVITLEPDYGLTDVSWHPSKPLIACYGATGEPMSPDAPINRGFGIIDARTKRIRSKMNLDLGERVAFDWLPDGSRLATDHFIVDTRTWQYRRYNLGSEPPSTFTRQMSISPHHDVVRETANRQTGLPSIQVFQTQTAGFGPFTESADMSSATDFDTNRTVVMTQPRFLTNGRLAFVRAVIDVDTSRVEVWTCSPGGKDRRPWVRLQRLGQGKFGPYSLAPVTYSADGRVLAYVDGLTVKVFRVASRFPKHHQRAITVTTQDKPQATLRLLKTIKTPMTDAEMPRQLAIDRNAILVALLVTSSVSGTRVEIYNVATGKQMLKIPPYKYNTIAYMAWNHKRPVLALYSTVGEMFEPDIPPAGFVFVNVRTKRVHTFLDLQLGERVPFDWMPDGTAVATDHYIVNAATGKLRRFELNVNPFTGARRNLAISPRGVLAGEVADSWQSMPNIYLFEPQSAKFDRLDKVGELRATQSDGRSTIRTQPKFLSDGRLAYVKAQLNTDGTQASLGVWTSDAKGANERLWVALPRIGAGVDGDYSVSPVIWSPDGKTLAFAEDKVIKVFAVVKP